MTNRLLRLTILKIKLQIFADRLATCKIKCAASVLKRKKLNSSKMEKYEKKLLQMAQVTVPILFYFDEI